MALIYIDNPARLGKGEPLLETVEDFAALCEIEFGAEATGPTVLDSFSALCEIEFGGAASYDGEPVVCEIDFGGSAQVSIDGSPDVFLEATCEIEFGAEAAVGVTDYFFATCSITFDAEAGANIAEAETYRINVIIDVVQGGWDDPNTP